MPEGFWCLPGQSSPGRVGDRAGDGHRQPPSQVTEQLVDSERSGTRIERVKNRFDHEQVDAAANKPRGRLLVGFNQFIKIDVARSGVFYIGR